MLLVQFRYVKIKKSSKRQFKYQANLILTKKLILGSSPDRPDDRRSNKRTGRRYAYAHTTKVYNNDQIRLPTSERTNESSPKRFKSSSFGGAFPDYFDNEKAPKSRSKERFSPAKSNRRRNSSSFRRSSNRSHSSSRSGHRESLPIRLCRSGGSIRSPPKSRLRNKDGTFFQSYYNETKESPADKLSSLSEKCRRIVRVRDLPSNCEKEDLFKFFEGFNLLPKSISIFNDRIKREVEAEVEFKSLEDAKRSFILSGARVRSSDGYVKHIDITLHPELKKVNIINPLSRSITTKYNKEKHIYKDLNMQFFPFENYDHREKSTSDKKLHSKSKKYYQDEDSHYYSNKPTDKEGEYALSNFLTNSILIDQLKDSLDKNFSIGYNSKENGEYSKDDCRSSGRRRK